MKTKFATILVMATLASACSQNSEKNPLLTDFSTPFGVPPFDRIRTEHFLPAFEASIEEARTEVEAIAGNTETPTFANTIEALEFSGKRLGDVASIFFNLNSAETNEEMEKIALEVSPMITEFSNDINLNPELFQRVKAVYEDTDRSLLTPEQQTLLEKTYQGFIRSGAALEGKDQERYREITTELSNLSVQFGQNVLAATNGFILHLSDSTELAGLPSALVESAREEATNRDLDGWVFTLQAPSYVPFLKYSENRALREKMWRAYNSRSYGGEFDNTGTVLRITELRRELANLLGYETYADYVLERKMADKPQVVNDFLAQLAEKSGPFAREDYRTVNEYAAAQGLEGDVMPWDFSFYSEKYKDEQYAVNDELIRPYLPLDKVEKGLFDLAHRLYGIELRENKSIPVYHPDVKAFEVYDEDGSFLSILYIDYFPREGKRGGAWMTSYRDQYVENGVETRPVISIVCNFTKPTASGPSLLTFSEAETLHHEFGHALHGMLTKGTYPGLTGTSVFHDFVELPSQIMENWMVEPEYLDLWAEHYQTGEKMPKELIDKITASKNFLSGYASARQVSFGLMDMAWHSLKEPYTGDIAEFENRASASVQVLPVIKGSAMSPSFQHIFAGGYAAGYYGYKWSEVLDADAFSMFKEKGIFDRDVARSFREHILSKGGSEPPMELYVRFRGQEPTSDALFERSGLVEKQ